MGRLKYDHIKRLITLTSDYIKLLLYLIWLLFVKNPLPLPLLGTWRHLWTTPDPCMLALLIISYYDSDTAKLAHVTGLETHIEAVFWKGFLQ